MKFLHISDVHLGCTRYQLPESPRDFYDAWIDVLRKYAIAEKVDFVIMCGDFFHKRAVPPETMNYAVEGLTELRDAGIPVVAIEGNHDQKHTNSEFSWLRSLSSWKLLHLLEPDMIVRSKTSAEMTLSQWDDASRRGGYIDIGRARIFGSDWYGATANWAIPMLTEAIGANRREEAFHILLLHTDVEGHQVHPIPALSVDALRQLRSVVDYVGLGHTHKHYEIDNWAFNPGSIEVTNITEFRETRGAFIVEVGEDNSVSSRHVTDYWFRPFERLEYAVDDASEGNDVTRGVLALVNEREISAEPDKPRPIVEIALRGRLGFPNSLIDSKAIRDEVQRATGALHVRIKNQTIPADYLDTEVPAGDDDRAQVERQVIGDLVHRDKRFQQRPDAMADAIIGAKRMALGDEPADKIADFIRIATADMEA